MTTPEHCNKDAICELTKSSVGVWNNFDEQKRKIINTDFCFVFVDEIVGCYVKESKDYYRYCVYIRTDVGVGLMTIGLVCYDTLYEDMSIISKHTDHDKTRVIKENGKTKELYITINGEEYHFVFEENSK